MTLLRRLAGSRSAWWTHRVSFAKPTEAAFSQHPEEDDVDDREGIADPPILDRTYVRPQLGAVPGGPFRS